MLYKVYPNKCRLNPSDGIFIWLCFNHLSILTGCKGKNDYFPVRQKPILLNTLKLSMPIDTILKYSLLFFLHAFQSQISTGFQ